LKVILITGMTDPEIKRQAVEAGADAFFLKPVVMAEFLDTVDRCLDLAKPAPAAPASAGTKPSTGGLAERIASLRQELHAISAILLDERGRISVQAGDFPDAGIEATLFPALMGNFSIGEKISLLLGTTTPEDLFCYTGAKYDLFMSHVGPSYALLVMVSKAPRNESPGTIGVTIQKAAQELLSILTDLGVTPTIPEAVPAPPESETITEARLPELDNLFRLKRKKSLKPEEVDAFWDTLAENTTGEDVISTEALSYEQARRLGLLPDETAPEEPTD
jgi:CheY-like chemotaxis protein